MIYVYDTLVARDTKVIRRYGVNYKYEQRFRMGSRKIFSFVAQNHEKMMVVPEFAESYKEVEAHYLKFKKGQNLDYYKQALKKHVDRSPKVEDFPNDQSKTGVMQLITCHYKFIQVQFEFMNNELKMLEEFEIEDHNIFGNGLVIQMNVNTEEPEE